MNLPECPADVRKRADTLYLDSFRGFQRDRDRFIICWPGEKELEEKLVIIKQKVPALTLALGDWTGRDYFSVHWTEYNKIVPILDTMLKLGYSFQTQTKGMPSFDPAKDREFTFELLERKVIAQTSQLACDQLYFLISDAHCDDWNYTTSNGKALARRLRDQCLGHCYYTNRTNFYNLDIFKNCDMSTLTSIEEEEPCIVCLDEKADTMAMPCGHVVVCHECSRRLEQTPNSHVCVKCRLPVQHVVYK